LIKDIVARRYARALIASVEAKEMLDKIGEELKEISSVFKGSKELQNFFFNPAIPFTKKEIVLKEILKLYSFNPKLEKFIFLLLKNDWLKIIEVIYDQFMFYCDEYNNRVRAEITSAYELTDSEKKAIASKLSRYTGKDVVLKVAVDSRIIGGIIAKIGSLVIDGSIINYLQVIKNSLVEEV